MRGNNEMKKSRLVFMALVFSLVLGVAGCVGNSAQPQVVYPTVVIVQYVTQVVATVTPGAPAQAAQPGQPVSAGQPAVSGGQYAPVNQPANQTVSRSGAPALAGKSSQSEQPQTASSGAWSNRIRDRNPATTGTAPATTSASRTGNSIAKNPCR